MPTVKCVGKAWGTGTFGTALGQVVGEQIQCLDCLLVPPFIVYIIKCLG